MSEALRSDAMQLAALTNSGTEDIQLGDPVIGVLSATAAAKWQAAASARLNEIFGLGNNWDLRGSARVSKATLMFAWEMLSRIMPPSADAPVMVPLGHGGLQLLWHTSRGELEVEVSKPNQVSIFYFDRATDAEHEWDESTDFRRLGDIVWTLSRA